MSHDWFADKDFLQREYVDGQKSAAQIARELGCARSTVTKYVAELGLPLRASTPGEPTGQTPYGYRVVKGKIVQHRGEQQVIEQLAELRAAGWSYGRLTAWLNEQGIKTKNSAKQWDRPTVYKILKRHASGVNSVAHIVANQVSRHGALKGRSRLPFNSDKG